MKLLQKIVAILKKLLEILKKIWTKAREMIISEAHDLKERAATLTPKNVIKHTGRSLKHFFGAALITAGLSKTNHQWILDYVRLPFVDCIDFGKGGVTVRPIRLGFRFLERIYHTLMYDTRHAFFSIGI